MKATLVCLMLCSQSNAVFGALIAFGTFDCVASGISPANRRLDGDTFASKADATSIAGRVRNKAGTSVNKAKTRDSAGF